MTKTMAGTLALLGVVAMGSARMLSLQDYDAEVARQAAAQKATQQKMENAANQQNKARRDFLKAQEAQSTGSLASAVNAAAEQKKKENDLKFKALQQSSKELMDLSEKTFNQIHSSGGQAVFVSLFLDLDKMEKLIKDMRKNAK